MLLIGRQNRPNLYALHIVRPRPLTPEENWFTVRERIGASGEVVTPLDEAEVDRLIATIQRRGLRHVAVCLLFSFVNPAHEQLIGERCRRAGLTVSLSSEVLPEFREYERASTTVDQRLPAADGRGVPARRCRTESGHARSSTARRPCASCTPAAGRSRVAEAGASAARLVLSGPAGGVMGAAFVAAAAGFTRRHHLRHGRHQHRRRRHPRRPARSGPPAASWTACRWPCRCSTSSPSARAAGPSPGSMPAAPCASAPARPAPSPAPPATPAAAPSRPSPTPTCSWAASCPTPSPAARCGSTPDLARRAVEPLAARDGQDGRGGGPGHRAGGRAEHEPGRPRRHQPPRPGPARLHPRQLRRRRRPARLRRGRVAGHPPRADPAVLRRAERLGHGRRPAGGRRVQDGRPPGENWTTPAWPPSSAT